MTPNYDPRRPKTNPELKQLLRLIDRQHKDLKSAGTHRARRGHAAVLRATLEMFLDEPEFLQDLRDGPAAAAPRALLDPASFPEEVPFLSETPFETGGEAANRFFFYTSSGAFSPLFEGPALDPYYMPPLHRHGPYVYTLEKRYASAKATACRLSGEDALRRAAPRRKPGSRRDKPIFVLCDPAGLEPGASAALTAIYANAAKARDLADRLAAELNIRFITAAVRFAFCTH